MYLRSTILMLSARVHRIAETWQSVCYDAGQCESMRGILIKSIHRKISLFSQMNCLLDPMYNPHLRGAACKRPYGNFFADQIANFSRPIFAL